VALDTNVGLSALVYLVTADRDMLSLVGEYSCPILAADQFLSARAKACSVVNRSLRESQLE
jgi:predicted nucleic acid-binding protein